MSLFLLNCKRNIKIAAKSVLSSWKEYLCFFVALIVVQSAFCLAGISYSNNRKNERALLEDEYDYHAALRNLTGEQYLFMLNDTYNQNPKYHIYDVVRLEETVSGASGKTAYDMFISFASPIAQSYSNFQIRYYAPLHSGDYYMYADFEFETSPLFDYELGSSLAAGEYTTILIIVAALSFLLLMILYRIRLNHFKFTYSIYMTCGADYKKLLGSAFWEMFVIALLCVIPSAIISNITALIVYLCGGARFGFYIAPILLMIVFSLIVSLLSVLIPIKALSLKRPMKLMIAEDNSNLVASPRRSFKLLGKRFPIRSELYSLWRFRRYFAGLIASAVLFSSLFVCGIYISDVYASRRDYKHSEFTLSGNFQSGDCRALESVQEASGVADVVASKSVLASLIDSHILVSSSSCRDLSSFAVFPAKREWAGNMLVDYSPADRGTLDDFDSFYGYEYIGDPSLVLSDGRYCVISDSMANKTVYDIKPGDTIMVAMDSFLLPRTAPAGDLLRGNELLTALFEKYSFSYRAFEVAAVITNMPSDERTTVFFSQSDFQEITGHSSSYSEAEVYLETGLSAEEIDKIAESLAEVGRNNSFSLIYNHASTDARIENAKNYYGIFTLFSVLIFIICPLIFVFSQVLFYRKRSEEYDMMRAMGAVSSEIRRIHIIDACTLGALSGLVFAVFSKIEISLLCRLCNWKWFHVIFSPTSVGEVIRYYDRLPAWAFITGLVISVVSAAASCIVPYIIYKKRTSDKIGEGEFSQE